MRPKDIRIALNPLAMKLKNFIQAIGASLEPISVKDKKLARQSAPDLSKLHSLVGQVNYELNHSQNQVASLLDEYGERIDSALDQIDQLDEMAELAKKSAQSLISLPSPAARLPHDIKEISLDKVDELLKT